MTLPLYLVEPHLLAALSVGGSTSLEGDEGRHAATVRRTRVGEALDLADGAGRVARCTVSAVGRDRLELVVDSVVDVPRRVPALVLAQALAKGGRDELAIETATELGVDEVIPWQSERSVSIWVGEKIERGRRRWSSAVREASKQARRATVPEVGEFVNLGGLLERVSASGTQGLVLHEEAALTWGGLTLESAGVQEIVVVVGPEGGLSAREVEELVAAGALAVRLGPEVLRTSTAGPTALALLNLAMGRWG